MDGSDNSAAQSPSRLQSLGPYVAVLVLLGLFGVGIVLILTGGRHLRQAWFKVPEGQTYLGAHGGGAWALAFAPDGQLLASGGGDGKVKLWDLVKRQDRATLTGHTGAIAAVAFSPDSNTLATGGGFRDGLIRLWDVPTGKRRDVFGIPPPVGRDLLTRKLAFSPDGKRLAVGMHTEEDGSHWRGLVVLWDPQTGQQLQTYVGLVSASPVIDFTPDGRTLAVTDGQRIRLFEVTTGKERAVLQREGSGAIIDLGISPDGKILVTVDIKDVWSKKAPRELRQIVVLWDLATNQPTTTFALPQPVPPARHMALSHNGKILATAGEDGFVRLWTLPEGKELASLQGPGGKIHAVCFAPDDNMLAFACANGAVLLADVKQSPGQ